MLRPLQAADVPELTRIIDTPAVARWWDDGAPWEESDATMLTIVAEDRIAGLIQYAEELDRKYRHASIDIFVDPALHGRGIGTEAIRQLARHLIEERGHHRITIDPAAANMQAIRAYEKAGFRHVGRRRDALLHGGRRFDEVLMDAVPGDLTGSVLATRM